MQTLRVALGERSYPIYIGAGILERADLIVPLLRSKKIAIVTNTTVAPLYLATVVAPLARAGFGIVEIVVADGETHKNWETLNTVYDRLLAAHCDRQTAILALGGGVIGDLAGFAAATYQRGVPFIQLPTTLLAQVDSSVGGKTAINHPRGKNMIGAFYQPLAVLADTDSLRSLPERELRAGLAEVIKHGVIRDAQFFAWLERDIELLLVRQSDALTYAVQRSCKIKAEIVARDERETGERALLNFGHTFGHAIENAMGYGTWLHGEAVAAGMALAADLSHRLGRLPAAELVRLIALLKRAGLPTGIQGISSARLAQLMSLDKKVDAGRMRFVLIERLGEAAIVDDIPPAALSATLALAA